MGTSLRIGNLSASVTEADLLELFRRIGPVETSTIMTSPETGLSKGIAFVRMTNEMDAMTAISRLNFSQHDGRVISVRQDPRVKGACS
jgi:RNA recognition motif-containing protein